MSPQVDFAFGRHRSSFMSGASFDVVVPQFPPPPCGAAVSDSGASSDCFVASCVPSTSAPELEVCPLPALTAMRPKRAPMISSLAPLGSAPYSRSTAVCASSNESGFAPSIGMLTRMVAIHASVRWRRLRSVKNHLWFFWFFGRLKIHTLTLVTRSLAIWPVVLAVVMSADASLRHQAVSASCCNNLRADPFGCRSPASQRDTLACWTPNLSANCACERPRRCLSLAIFIFDIRDLYR